MLNSGKKIRALRDKKVNILTLVKWSVPYNKQKNKDYRETRFANLQDLNVDRRTQKSCNAKIIIIEDLI
jgi:hypothetical protein